MDAVYWAILWLIGLGCLAMLGITLWAGVCAVLAGLFSHRDRQ